ncbi:hypothetical protein DV20_08065 [Amycolatopsis rifamycinica]|uniref:Anti-sigma factor antagonist n=1 Tax=Amycolatopsis rifamycinica TaxID=287986 RepID=A0A066U5G2_9PSEU|nr:hypothetical protein DV20_08065 [Amycolatopsis rifamycinica]
MLSTAATSVGDIGVVTVSGDVDHVVRTTFQEAMAAALARRPRGLVVDLTPVRFFGSTGLSVLAWLYQAAADAGIAVTLVATQHSVLTPMAITRVDELFAIHPTVEQAVAHHGKPPATAAPLEHVTG